MESKQLFTKIALSVLIGLNVGGFYVFWPHQDGGARTLAKPADDEPGATQLLPVPPGKPGELPNLGGTVPLSIPGSPGRTEAAADDESVRKLLDHIKKEPTAARSEARIRPIDQDKQANPAKQGDLPTPPLFPSADLPTTRAPIEVGAPVENPNVGVTSPLAPRVPETLWVLQTDKMDGRTQAIATLRKPGRQPVEFRIHCDRVESKGSEFIALGKVIFAGVGLNGACQRLTLTVTDRRIVFEGDVHLVRAGDSQLRGERIVWEVAAADANPSVPGVPGLGAPK